MQMNTELHEGILLLRLSGNLIGEKAQGEILEGIETGLQAGAKALILDLAAVPHMNSSGLGTLVTIHTRMQRSGHGMVLSGLSEGVRQLLTITKLLPIFRVAGSVESARELIS